LWHEKELSLLKVMSAKHWPNFAAQSLVIVTAAGYLKNCSGSYQQTNTNQDFTEQIL
jgi:hypothetical protein